MIETRGRSLADALVRTATAEAARFHQLTGRPATLAIMAGDDGASRRYLEFKQRRFQEAGLAVRAFGFGPAAGTTEVLLQVHALNADPAVDAIFLQFPLPAGVDVTRAGDSVDPDKDIDVAGSANLGRVLAGTAEYLPATAAAVLRLLDDELSDLGGRSVVVVGTAGSVDRTIALQAHARGGTGGELAPGAP
ncbi:MAG: bifunctional 5,10-methylenetetrahydrofolate dehydrogenase/5,10-methenyltetrahydrofolate cyclohydrolase, partial [Gemmatimonadetes bacterium]|nr:bifunctional 5,10-methylenetetrahydrofolate dehydrogenase/5,10-methenyltetrahydrofolate cyclohydrolase [Gemmatimonadota bacterium]